MTRYILLDPMTTWLGIFDTEAEAWAWCEAYATARGQHTVRPTTAFEELVMDATVNYLSNIKDSDLPMLMLEALSDYELRHTDRGDEINCIACGKVVPLRFIGKIMVCEPCYLTLPDEVKALASPQLPPAKP